MTIRKKIWQEYYEKIINGEKKFDVRLADFEVNEGDTLVLEEWDHKKNKYTGRRIETKITYVLKTKDCPFWTEEEIDKYGYQILQLEVGEQQ